MKANYVVMLLIIGVMFSSCNSTSKKVKLTPISTSIDGYMGINLKIAPKKNYTIIVNESTLSYEMRVLLQSQNKKAVQGTGGLYLELLDEEGNPISEFSKFDGPTQYNEELQAILNGNKQEMTATFTLNGIALLDVVESIETLQKGRSLSENKKEIIRRLNTLLKESSAKKFKISSY